MTAHPHGPKKKGKPKKSRHTVEKHDARGEVSLLERDVQRVLAWLNASPLRTITSEGLRAWIAEQAPPWTHGYATSVKTRVQQVLTEATGATAPEVRARLLHLVDGLIPACSEVLFWKSCNPTDPAVKDPRTPEFRVWRQWVLKRKIWDDYVAHADVCARLGLPAPTQPFPKAWGEDESRAMDAAGMACPLMHVINHAAAANYIKILGQLTGVMSEKHQHLHLHGAVQGGDLSEVPEAELIEAARILPPTEQNG